MKQELCFKIMLNVFCLLCIFRVVIGHQQFGQKNMHCGRNRQPGFRRYPEAHGLCGLLQRCLVGPHRNCSLSLLPVAGMSPRCTAASCKAAAETETMSVPLSFQHLGPSALAGIATVILIFPLNGIIAKKRSKLQVKGKRKERNLGRKKAVAGMFCFAPVGSTSATLCQGATAGFDMIREHCGQNDASSRCPFDVAQTTCSANTKTKSGREKKLLLISLDAALNIRSLRSTFV